MLAGGGASATPTRYEDRADPFDPDYIRSPGSPKSLLGAECLENADRALTVLAAAGPANPIRGAAAVAAPAESRNALPLLPPRVCEGVWGTGVCEGV